MRNGRAIGPDTSRVRIVNNANVQDDSRLTVAFRGSEEQKGAIDALLSLELEGHAEFEERFIVSEEGSELYIYGDSEEAIG